ncbi:X-linked retinitis pigmentosa GTPase regulator [Eupeodes corollae]|uniref:X-linked retinitis pigmentosa GTPase regulator n=1 Tax=Eupeodes corollae TaxID=290404 RepID=UPI002491151D|nr:X-linked retinitis pigmentosa GTPase regulator [Eupeodes corollae]
MDIPNTGAIFTLGKSHLAENTQSYFYIKNDPVRRLTSGANQSAVICESGRLFVWGENYFGQLGVGTNNNNTNNIITKPTCVKSLKTLGLKIADIAFGHGWAVILTHSNEIFFTGRNIFPSDTKVSENFTTTTIGTEKYSIIRKPFRLEELDNCLQNSEDPENFVSISAGNDHFVMLTSVGRLIAWGSNSNHQLGSDDPDLREPYEVQLDFKVKQFVCGPSSTLILTENGNLYLTGKLSEFTFQQFTELQKNLSAQEEILFMHISQASEIYIVTTEGGIYRSMESTRHNSLIFQRFYDYDSEENGQIVKLLRGTSFFAALTKANKFYTTFSESGHHLKTFREISKFKNLRTLDMVVGDQHILVHGIPRSAANKLLNKTFVVRPDLNGNINQIGEVVRVVEQNIPEESEEPEENGNQAETIKPNTPVKEKVEVEEDHIEVKEISVESNENKKEDVSKDEEVKEVKEEKPQEKRPPSSSSSKDLDIFEDTSPTNSMKSARYRRLDDSEWDSNNSTPSKKTILTANAGDSSSPTSPVKSRKSSSRSISFDEKALAQQVTTSAERKTRPKTPYPDGTPLKPNKLNVKEEETLEKTSPELHDSLENIPGSVADNQQQENGTTNKKTSAKKRALTPIVRTNEPMMSSDEDEQLAVEISSTELLGKTVVNEIRFINNGVDVTDISKRALEEETPVKEKPKQILEQAGESIHKATDAAKNLVEEKPKQILDQAGEAIHKATDAAKHSAITAAEVTVQTLSKEKDKAIEKVSEEAENIGGKITSTLSAAAGKVSSEVDSAVGKVSEKFDSTVSAVSEGVDNTVSSVSQKVNTTTNKISSKVEDAKQSLSNFFTGGGGGSTSASAGGHKEASPNLSSNVSTAVTTEETYTPKDESKIDDDERTTASVNSNLNGVGNTFENERDKDFEPAKRTLGDEIRTTGENGKGRVMQFISDLKAKGKGISCRDQKSVRVADEPPKYTPVDELADQTDNKSKVCTIL